MHVFDCCICDIRNLVNKNPNIFFKNCGEKDDTLILVHSQLDNIKNWFQSFFYIWDNIQKLRKKKLKELQSQRLSTLDKSINTQLIERNKKKIIGNIK